MKNNFWKVSTLVLAILLTLSFTVNVVLLLKSITNKTSDEIFTGEISSSLIKSVSAEDIYPLFFCPCCGQPLDKNKICCGLAKERIDYIDSLVETKDSEDEIILAYVKKYGLNSFVDKNKQNEVREKLIAVAPSDRPIISFNSNSYDFGDVSQKNGEVYTYFVLKNEGKTDLVIDRLETSCGCTSASVVFQNKEGPTFTMPGHGKENPGEWQVVIPAGEIAQLKVYYDPDVHKDFRGVATREISVFSNDPIDSEKKVKIELDQVD